MNSVDLRAIIETLKNIKPESGDLPIGNIEAAINALESAKDCLEAVTVKGRENLDKLLGVMLVIDMIIGKEQKG